MPEIKCTPKISEIVGKYVGHQCVMALLSRGFKVPTIFERLQQEKVDITLCAVYNLVQKYCTKGMQDRSFGLKDLP